MTGTVQLNLTRKWRSRTFDEIVGQKLPVRLLKNSLYRGQIFPVYLLSGLRGSGKTSMGRIFASAVNCQKLSEFRAHPQNQKLPCLACPSCVAMREGNHPDFIEMDAASHTGVDNIRQIIEAASFLPVMGGKKIYLIDEAHMLSKAAFNAFLKILEEPPATVLFLLATTDPQKIIETVKSRSFQLFFDPIHVDDLVPHLARVCDQEKIEYEQEALMLVARESEGSARDALNLIERIRLAEGKVFVDAVHRSLGAINDLQVIKLFRQMSQGSLQDLFEQLHQMEIERYSAKMLWQKMIAMVRALVWSHHGIAAGEFGIYYEQIKELVPSFSLVLLTEFLEMLYRAEAQFLKTSAQHALLEGILCKMAQRSAASVTSSVAVASVREVDGKKKPTVVGRVADAPQEPLNQNVVRQDPAEKNKQNWALFLREIEQQGNHVVLSIFQHGTVLSYEKLVLRVRFAKKFEFYSEWLISNETVWKPYLERLFGAGVSFLPDFSGDNPLPEVQVQKKTVNHVVAQSSESSAGARKSYNGGLRGSSVRQKLDVSDEKKWSKAHMFLRLFSGTVHVVQE